MLLKPFGKDDCIFVGASKKQGKNGEYCQISLEFLGDEVPQEFITKDKEIMAQVVKLVKYKPCAPIFNIQKGFDGARVNLAGFEIK